MMKMTPKLLNAAICVYNYKGIVYRSTITTVNLNNMTVSLPNKLTFSLCDVSVLSQNADATVLDEIRPGKMCVFARKSNGYLVDNGWHNVISDVPRMAIVK